MRFRSFGLVNALTLSFLSACGGSDEAAGGSSTMGGGAGGTNGGGSTSSAGAGAFPTAPVASARR